MDITKTNNYYLMIILLITSLILWTIYSYWSKRHIYRTIANMSSPPALPIIGHLYLLFISTRELLPKIADMTFRYESPVKVWLAHHLYIGTIKSEHVKIILNHPKAMNKNYFYEFLKMDFALFTASAEVWKRHRKSLAPAFNQKILHSFIEIFESKSSILIKNLEKEANNKEFNVYSNLFKHSFNTLAETVFGTTNVDKNMLSEFFDILQRTSVITTKRILNIHLQSDLVFCLTGLNKKYTDELKRMFDIIKEIMNEKIEKYQDKIQEPEFIAENTEKTRKIFIELLIEMIRENKINEEELLHEITGFFLAGTESTTLTNGYVLMMLGIHQEIQDKMYSEINDIFGSNIQNITENDLAAMKYTEMVILETMRLFPILPYIARTAAGDIQLDDKYTIPSSSNIIIPIISIHHNPKIWADPLKFDPERFSSERITEQVPYNYIPFSAGPRNCIGFRYAMLVMKTTLAAILHKYKINCSYKNSSEIKCYFDIVLKPEKGHIISIEKRT